LATFAGIVAQIAIAPDGQTVMVAEVSPEHPSAALLYLVDSDGHASPEPLFEGWDAEWSPNSRHIRLINVPSDTADSTLSVYEVATSQTITLESARRVWTAKWSPDSTRLAYSTGSDGALADGETWLWDRVTGHTRLLAEGTVVAWFPDGLSLAVIKSGGQNVPLERVWLDGSSAVALGEESGFAISPNGEFIARRIFTEPQKTELRIASGGIELVVPGPVEPAGDMAFSPDSKTLAFIGQEYTRNAGGAIVDATGVNAYTVSVDGTNVRKVAETAQSAILGWTPEGAVLFASVRGVGCEEPFG
jgi:WD40 repeat protein